MRVLKYFVICLVVLLVLLAVAAATFPARVAWRYAAPQLPMLRLAGISGSVWDGHAARASINGYALGALSWQADVLPLLQGRLRVHGQVQGDGLTATGIVTRHMDGHLEIADGHLEMSGPALGEALQLASVELAGTVQLDIARALVRHGWLQAVSADGQWLDASITGDTALRMGTLDISIGEDSPPEITADVHDRGEGEVRVQGTLSLKPMGYQFRAHLWPQDPDNWRVQGTLEMLGPRQGDGSVLLTATGTLLP